MTVFCQAPVQITSNLHIIIRTQQYFHCSKPKFQKSWTIGNFIWKLKLYLQIGSSKRNPKVASSRVGERWEMSERSAEDLELLPTWTNQGLVEAFRSQSWELWRSRGCCRAQENWNPSFFVCPVTIIPSVFFFFFFKTIITTLRRWGSELRLTMEFP